MCGAVLVAATIVAPIVGAVVILVSIVDFVDVARADPRCRIAGLVVAGLLAEMSMPWWAPDCAWWLSRLVGAATGSLIGSQLRGPKRSEAAIVGAALGVVVGPVLLLCGRLGPLVLLEALHPGWG